MIVALDLAKEIRFYGISQLIAVLFTLI